MLRLLIAAVGALGLGLFPGLLTRAAAQASYQGEHKELVVLYASGQRPKALALLGNWTEARTRKQIDLLKGAVVTIRSCAGCPTRVTYANFPLRAALLLHADREIQQHLLTPVSEQRPPCGNGLHSLAVEHLAAILVLVDPEAGPFLRRFYLAMSEQARWSQCLDEAEIWARAGLRLYPTDASLKLALGIAAEKLAFFTIRPSPITLAAGTRGALQKQQMLARIRGFQETARLAFQETLAIDGSFAEARLRLGRVQWLMGLKDKARESLEKTLETAPLPETQYLAHLFLGRVMEDGGSLDIAESHYRAALALRPQSETAALAVSHARFLRGDTMEARAALLESIQPRAPRVEFDPWLTYSADQDNHGEDLLAALRSDLK